MCTVSWAVKDSSYRLYFNRDEQRTRERALLPRERQRSGTKLIAPRDPKGGGSWIAVNEHGITSFLLNNYAAGNRDCRSGSFRSRGELPVLLASQSSLEASLEALEKLDLAGFRPFYIGLIEPSRECQIFSWNGKKLDIMYNDIPFLTTSSYRSDEVEGYRRRRYLEVCGKEGCERDPDQSFDFHRDLSHPDKSFNPLMSREDAKTHCISVVSVTPSQVRFEYFEMLADGVNASPAKVCSIERKGAIS